MVRAPLLRADPRGPALHEGPMTHNSPARVAACLGMAFALAATGLLAAAPASAATTTVSDQQGLIDAMNAANASPDSDTIVLTGAGFTLTDSLPAITAELTITGPGSGAFTLDAAGFDLVNADPGPGPGFAVGVTGLSIVNTGYIAIYLHNVAVAIDDVVIEEGDGLADGCGLELGDVTGTVEDSAFSTNCDEPVAQLSSQADLTIADTVFSGTDASGMIVTLFDTASLTLTNVTSTDHAGNGLQVSANNDSTLVISGGEYDGNGDNGIYLEAWESASVAIDGVVASHNRDDGIELSLSDESVTSVTGVSADGNGTGAPSGCGFLAHASGFAELIAENTAASGNGYCGLHFNGYDDSSASYSDVSAQDNGATQMEYYALHAATLVIDGVTASGSRDAGVTVSSESSVAATVSNVVSTGNSPGLVLATYGSGSAVSVDNASISGAVSGPGVYSFGDGAISLTGSTIFDNPVGGIYIENEASPVTITDSTITRNGIGGGAAEFGGVFVWSPHANVTLDRTTISDNAAFNGAGVLIYPRRGGMQGAIAITDSTISGNSGGEASGINSYDGIAVSLLRSTITANDTSGAGAVVRIPGAGSTLSHTVIADNLRGFDLATSLTTVADHSLVGTGDAGAAAVLAAGTGNIVGVPAMLAPLADNGGIVRTHLPLAGSPLIDAGDPAVVGAPALDQRDSTRIVRTIDIGSVEVAGVAPAPGPTVGPAPQPAPVPAPAAEPTADAAIASGRLPATGADSVALPLTLAATLLLAAAGLFVLARRRRA